MDGLYNFPEKMSQFISSYNPVLIDNGIYTFHYLLQSIIKSQFEYETYEEVEVFGRNYFVLYRHESFIFIGDLNDISVNYRNIVEDRGSLYITKIEYLFFNFISHLHYIEGNEQSVICMDSFGIRGLNFSIDDFSSIPAITNSDYITEPLREARRQV